MDPSGEADVLRKLVKVVKALGSRLAYLGLLRHRGTWRWLIDTADYLVVDHVEPWSELQRSPASLIHPSVSFRCARNVLVGPNTRIQPNSVLWASPGSTITIGAYTGLGPGTMIFSSNHRFALGEPYHKQPWDEKSVTIGRDVWVGAGTIILPGVTIGDCCVIAAGSVVTKDIPPNSLAAGVPAKVLRARDPLVSLPGPGDPPQ